MKLTIVTVVFNDLNGLQKTVANIMPLLNAQTELWVIDGSTNSEIADYLGTLDNPSLQWLSEPDDGLYDAMNKGVDRARGDHLIFMNAGDRFYPGFDPAAFLDHHDCAGKVVLGYSMEVFQQDRYLRPGLGRDSNAFSSPSHQATFYPRSFYVDQRYRLDLPISADGDYTARAIARHSAIFLPSIVCEFELGGVSSHYGSMRVLKMRLKEGGSARALLNIACKFALWAVLPQRLFYRALASYKYTYYASSDLPSTPAQVAVSKPETTI